MWKRGWCVLLLAASLAVGGGRAEEGAPASDPVWGGYSSLVGRSAQAGKDGYTLRWSWKVPGRELVQEYYDPNDGPLAHRDTITPGDAPGTLVLQSSYMGRKRWHGTVQPDGQVLFIGKGLLKLPYLAGFGESGAWEIRQVELSGGKIASVEQATRYNRFVLAEGGTDEAVANVPAKPDGGSVAPVGALAAGGPVVAAEAAPAPTPVSATPAPVEPADFGVMNEFVGRRFVYRNALAHVSLADGGRTLVLQFGNLLFHLRATDRPDRYEVVQHSRGLSPKAERLPNGTIEVSYSTRSIDDMIGTRYRMRFSRSDQGGIRLSAESKSIAGILAGWDFDWSEDYRPYSDTAVAEERQYAQWDREDRADIARRRAAQQAEMDAAWQRGIANMTGNLNDYAAREQQRMDESQAMLDEINAMARAEAEAQRRAEQQAALDSAARQRAAQQQLAQQQYQASRPATRVATSTGATGPGTAAGANGSGAADAAAVAQPGNTAAPAAAKPLQFVLTISMKNLPGDAHNSRCYSNVITRPGPPGWGAPGFLPSGSAEQALGEINALKGAFIAACQRSGREITSEGNFSHVRNQGADGDQRVQATKPRFQEDVSVVVN